MGKGFKVVLIILLSIIAVALTGILTLMLVRGTKFNLNFSMKLSENLVEEKTIEEIKDLKIDTNIADVDIETSEDEKVTVKLYCDDCENHSIKNNDAIEVVLKDKRKTFRLFSKGPRIVITVPKTYENNIGLKGDVADIEIASLKNASVNVELKTGDIDIDEINKASVKVTTGDVKIGRVNDLVVKATTGDVKLQYVGNFLDIALNTGDVKIERLNINESSKIKNNTGDIKIGTINDIYVDAKNNIGDTKVNTNDRKSDIVLTINSNVGDIKVG